MELVDLWEERGSWASFTRSVIAPTRNAMAEAMTIAAGELRLALDRMEEELNSDDD